ncbi:hypothetical protein D5S17_01705 [Pseudonocardiaceae bacterium YIM PH 21723]|nr:hypothetical protein D5S17_01705 [Pseudonocardiaceae bacterium YIM PH 21723]
MSGRRGAGSPLTAYPLLDWYFGVTFGATLWAMFNHVAPDEGHSPLWATLPLIALACCYLGLGRRLLREDRQGAAGNGYLLLCCLLLASAISLWQTADFLLFALVPLAFLVADRVPAIVATVGMKLFAPLWFATHTAKPVSAFEFFYYYPITILMAVLIGIWLRLMVRRSREHIELAAELARSRERAAELDAALDTAAEQAYEAAESHDTLAQGFAGVVTLTQAAGPELRADPESARSRLRLAAETARERLAEVPAARSDVDEALRQATEQLAAQLMIPVGYRSHGEQGRQSAVTEAVLLRAGRQALADLRWQPAATGIQVDLRFAATAVALEITQRGPDAVDQLTATAEQLRSPLVTTTVLPGAEDTATLRIEVPGCPE